MKAGKPSVPTIHAYLAKRLPKHSRVGIDPFVHSVSAVETLEKVGSNSCVCLCESCVFVVACDWEETHDPAYFFFG